MSEAVIRLLDDDAVVLLRTGVRFPIELRPAGFRPEQSSTWPDADGQLEWVEGRLSYMPPCVDLQQDVAVDVVHTLRTWSETHSEFVVGGNEAGMKLGGNIARPMPPFGAARTWGRPSVASAVRRRFSPWK
jgi:hypothetical protein